MTYLDVLNDAWAQHVAPRSIDAPTVISTFSGCGGSSLGYSMAGYRELLAVEWDENAVDTFRLNFPDVPVYHDDIAKLSVDECLHLAGLNPGELDVLDGSPPCQGFSTAGKRNLDDSRNQLFREFVRLLRGLQPKVFVMENVSGMVKGKMKLVFADCIRELKASGYVVSARLMNAMYFNVPQSRQRMIFIGVRNDLDVLPSHPKAQTRPLAVRDALPWIGGIRMGAHGFNPGQVIDGERRPAPAVASTGLGSYDYDVAITGRVGSQFRREAFALDRPAHTVGCNAEQSRSPIGSARVIHDTSGQHSEGDVTDRPAPAVLADRAGTHWIESTRIVDDSGGLHSHGDVTNKPCPAITVGGLVSNAYHFRVELPPSRAKAYDGEDAYNFAIVDPEKPSPTITIGSPGNDLGHPVERRKFTIAEVKCICSYPDPFLMIGSYAEQWARLGNSVPPLFMRSISEHIRANLLAPVLHDQAAD